MNHSPYQIFQKFFKVGIAQIVPVALTILLFITVLVIIISVIVLYDPFKSLTIGQAQAPIEEILSIFLFSFIFILCLSGLFAFLFSSYRFIQAKSKQDYSYIIKGMYNLNWGWFFLTLFTVVSTLFTTAGLVLYL